MADINTLYEMAVNNWRNTRPYIAEHKSTQNPNSHYWAGYMTGVEAAMQYIQPHQPHTQEGN